MTGTPLDAPAAAARRQWALDRMTEHLVDWGCPADSAIARARTLLDAVLDAGYALPVALQPVPRYGSGSTEEGRARARAVFEAARKPRGDAAPEATREPRQQPAGDDATGVRVGEEPPNRPRASQGVEP